MQRAQSSLQILFPLIFRPSSFGRRQANSMQELDWKTNTIGHGSRLRFYGIGSGYLLCLGMAWHLVFSDGVYGYGYSQDGRKGPLADDHLLP